MEILKKLQQNRIVTESEHYRLYYEKDTLGQKDINYIAEIQEQCFKKITATLDVHFENKILYNIFDDPYTVGKYLLLLRDEDYNEKIEYKTNAFAWYPNYVFCTYNETIKSIGCHEDAHLILYNYFQAIGHTFLNEGFSVAMDNYWLGIDPDKWAKFIISENYLKKITNLLDSNLFYNFHCLLSYPISGSFCGWFIRNNSINSFKNLYSESIQTDISHKLDKLKESYFHYLNGIDIENKYCTHFKKMFEENSIIKES